MFQFLLYIFSVLLEIVYEVMRILLLPIRMVSKFTGRIFAYVMPVFATYVYTGMNPDVFNRIYKERYADYPYEVMEADNTAYTGMGEHFTKWFSDLHLPTEYRAYDPITKFFRWFFDKTINDKIADFDFFFLGRKMEENSRNVSFYLVLIYMILLGIVMLFSFAVSLNYLFICYYLYMLGLNFWLTMGILVVSLISKFVCTALRIPNYFIIQFNMLRLMTGRTPRTLDTEKFRGKDRWYKLFY